MNQKIKELSLNTGLNLFICKKAFELCNNDENVAYEYLRLKSQPVVRCKFVKSKKVRWSEEDYLKEAKRLAQGR